MIALAILVGSPTMRAIAAKSFTTAQIGPAGVSA